MFLLLLLLPLGYIDPMSGAVVLQLIFGVIAGGLAFFRHTIIGSIRRMFGYKEINTTK